MKTNAEVWFRASAEKEALNFGMRPIKRVHRYSYHGEEIIALEGAIELPFPWREEMVKLEVEIPPALSEHWGVINEPVLKLASPSGHGFDSSFVLEYETGFTARFVRGEPTKLQGEPRRIIEILDELRLAHEAELREKQEELARQKAEQALYEARCREAELQRGNEVIDDFINRFSPLLEKARGVNRSDLEQVSAVRGEIDEILSPDDC